MKTFPSVVPDPPPGSDYSTREHPIQGFQWGDYTAKPGHAYTYAVSSLGGTPAALTVLGTSSVTVHTEVEDDGVHGIWFNRGVAGSQAFARKFAGWVPGDVPDEGHPAMVWLSRGLGEAFVAFCGEALDGDWALRGAFYELTWGTGLDALAAARARGVDVRLVVHGRDRDTDPAKDADRTAEEAHAAAQAHGLSDVVTWRTAPNKSALFHHKFLVLLHRGQPVAVWTGSTNLTLGAVYGHSNVGHLLRHRAEAEAFHAEWERVAAEQPTAALRTTHQSEPPVSETVPAPPDVTVVMSPRTGLSALQWYAALFDSAATSAHITGAFGLNAVFRDALAESRHTVMRTVLLEKVPPANQRIPLTDPNVRLATGSYLATSPLEQWAAERLTGFNVHVRFIHTKIILVDPLGEDPDHPHRIGQLLRRLDHQQRGEHPRHQARTEPSRLGARRSAGGGHLPHRVPPTVHALRVPGDGPAHRGQHRCVELDRPPRRDRRLVASLLRAGIVARAAAAPVRRRAGRPVSDRSGTDGQAAGPHGPARR